MMGLIFAIFLASGTLAIWTYHVAECLGLHNIEQRDRTERRRGR